MVYRIGTKVLDPETGYVYTFTDPGEPDPFTDEAGERFSLAGVEEIQLEES